MSNLDEAIKIFEEATILNNEATTEKPEPKQDTPIGKSQQEHSQVNDSSQQIITKEYSMYSFADFCKQVAPVKFFIKGYVYEGALEMMFGESAGGKSFLALDMACSIACDEIRDWHGQPLRHAPVIYFAGEGANGLRKRCAGWVAAHDVNPETVHLAIFDEVFSLDDEDNSDYSINNTIANIKRAYGNPGLIIFDTQHCFMKGDENRAVDTKKYLDACRKLTREFGCAVLDIHHVGVNPETKTRARGSGSMRGAMDFELRVSKNLSIITLEQTKNKDGAQEPARYFTLKGIDVPGWFDDEGMQETTCYIERTEPNLSESNEPKKTFTKSEHTALDTFKEAVRRKGVKLTDKETGHELIAVELKNWREISFELSAKGTQDSKRSEFNKGREGLYEKKILIKRTIEGYEYYCIDTSEDGKAESETKAAVAIAIHEREVAQASPPKPDAQIQLPIEPSKKPPHP